MQTSDTCTIDLQKTSYLENCTRSYPYNECSLLAASSLPTCHFHYLNNRIFLLENQVKKLCQCHFVSSSSFTLSEDFTAHDRTRKSESKSETNWYTLDDNAIDEG